MVGLHLRIKKNFFDALEYAQDLKLPFFQCFLLKEDKSYVKFDKSLIDTFALYKNYYKKLYLHSSYYVNLSDPRAYKIVMRELYWAKKLGFTHFILHPGAVQKDLIKNNKDCARSESIKIIGETLNRILLNEKDITILLENTAHGNKSIGGDISELAEIRSYLKAPERLKFCLDTAHAHSFGYEISSTSAQEGFLKTVDNLIGLDSIELIHLNDTHELLGSKIDKHAYLGQGVFGPEVLKSFISHPKLTDIDIILELPASDKETEFIALQTVLGWKKLKT